MEEKEFLKSCVAEEELLLIQDKVRDVTLSTSSSFPHLFFSILVFRTKREMGGEGEGVGTQR